MPATSPILGLPRYAIGGQGMASILGNEANNRLESAAVLRILNHLSIPPAGPAEADAYAVIATATADWVGQEGNVALFYNGGWIFMTPKEGQVAFFVDKLVWPSAANEVAVNCPYMYSSVESHWFPLKNRWSVNEEWTGEYNQDNSLIFSKVVLFSALPNGGTTPADGSQVHSITNLNLHEHISFESSVHSPTAGISVVPIPSTNPGTGVFANSHSIGISATSVVIGTDQDLSSFEAEVRLQYSRTGTI